MANDKAVTLGYHSEWTCGRIIAILQNGIYREEITSQPN